MPAQSKESQMTIRSFSWLRRSLPWLVALGLCMGCRKPAPEERVFTGNNGVRPGVTSENNGSTPMNGAGGTSGAGTTEYGFASPEALTTSECEPAAERQSALGDAMLELLDVLEDPALTTAKSSDPELSRVRQSVSVFRQRFEGCNESWLRQLGGSDVADRLRARLTALDHALTAAPGTIDVNDAAQSLGDELESAAVVVHDLEAGPGPR